MFCQEIGTFEKLDWKMANIAKSSMGNQPVHFQFKSKDRTLLDEIIKEPINVS